MIKKNFTKAEVKILTRLFSEGKKIKEIAAELNRSPKVCNVKLNRLGLYYRREYTPYSNKILKQAFALRLDGLLWSEISKKIGLKESKISLELQVMRVVSKAPIKRAKGE